MFQYQSLIVLHKINICREWVETVKTSSRVYNAPPYLLQEQDRVKLDIVSRSPRTSENRSRCMKRMRRRKRHWRNRLDSYEAATVLAESAKLHNGA